LVYRRRVVYWRRVAVVHPLVELVVHGRPAVAALDVPRGSGVGRAGLCLLKWPLGLWILAGAWGRRGGDC